MKTIRRLDSTGDTAVAFDENDVKAMAEAEALFERLKGEGRQAFAVNRGPGEPDKRIDSFKDTEAETVFIPRIQGG